MYETQVEKLSILYTANINGDLALLPRLYTYLQQLKAEQEHPVLFLDLGASCADDVWHCEVTGGRSTLIVLDGMGYHVANVEGFLDDGEYDKLRNSITMGLVDDAHSWRYNVPPVRDDSVIVGGVETPALTMCIVAAPAETTEFKSRTLYIATVDKGQVGCVTVDVPELKILTQKIYDMPSGLKIDATIAASVEFVEEEAQYLKKNSG